MQSSRLLFLGSFAGALVVVLIVVGFLFQKTDAQVNIDTCQREYNEHRSQCITNNNTCIVACSGDQNCEMSCNSQRNACDEAAIDQQRKCLGVWPYDQQSGQDIPVIDVPVINQKTQEKSVSPDNLIIQVDSADVARFESYVREEAKKIIEIKKCSGPSLPSQNPCVAEKLDFITAEARESLLVMSPFEKSSEPIIVEPVVIDTQGDVEPLDFSIVSVTDVAFDSFPIKLDLGDFQQFTSIYLPFPLENSPSEDSAEWRVYSQGAADMRSGESGAWKKIQFKANVTQDTAVATDKDRVVLASPGNTSVIEIGPNSVVGVEPMKTSEVKESVTATVYSGIVKVEDGESEDIFIQTPLTTTRSKHTKFAVLYNVEKLYAATIVYEGEVEVTDSVRGLAATISPTDDGKPRVIVTPLASVAGTQGIMEKLLNGNWIWILALVILAGGGYLLYRKRVGSFAQ